MSIGYTPYLHLALNGSAEENRNWQILDQKAVDLARNLIANIPAGGDLTGLYPDPTIREGVITGLKLSPAPTAADAGKVMTATGNGTFAWQLTPDSNWTDDGSRLIPRRGPTFPLRAGSPTFLPTANPGAEINLLRLGTPALGQSSGALLFSAGTETPSAPITASLSAFPSQAFVQGTAQGTMLVLRATKDNTAALYNHTVFLPDGTVRVTTDPFDPLDLTTKRYVDSKSGIADAPSDGQQYARKNAAWSVVTGGGGPTLWADEPGPQMLVPTLANRGIALPAGGDGLVIRHSNYPTIDRRTGIDADDLLLQIHAGSDGILFKSDDSATVIGRMQSGVLFLPVGGGLFFESSPGVSPGYLFTYTSGLTTLQFVSDGFTDFYAGGSMRLRVGGGTNPPVSIFGGLRLDMSTITPVAGLMDFNGTHFRGYNGTTWVNLDDTGGGGGGPWQSGSGLVTLIDPAQIVTLTTGGPNAEALRLGSGASASRTHFIAGGSFNLAVNRNAQGTLDDATRNGWLFSLVTATDGTDWANLTRLTPANVVQEFWLCRASTTVFDVTAAGGLNVQQTATVAGNTVCKALLSVGQGGDSIITLSPTAVTKGRVSYLPGFPDLALSQNASWSGSAWVRDDATALSWRIELRANTDEVKFAKINNAGVDTAMLSIKGNGVVTVTTDPIGNLDLATKQYVDNKGVIPSPGTVTPAMLSPGAVAGDAGKVVVIGAGGTSFSYSSSTGGSSNGSLGAQNFITTSATITTTNLDNIITASAAPIDVTLPAWSSALAGQTFRFTRTDSQPTRTVRIVAGAGDNIDGITTYNLPIGESVTLMAMNAITSAKKWVTLANQNWKSTDVPNVYTPLDGNKRIVLLGPPTSDSTDQGQLIFGTRTIKGRLTALPGADAIYISANAKYNSVQWAFDDSSKPTWLEWFDIVGDKLTWLRGAPSGQPATMMTLDATGGLTLPAPAANTLVWGSRTAKGRLYHNPAAEVLGMRFNATQAAVPDDATLAGWNLRCNLTLGGDQFSIDRTQPSGGSGAPTGSLLTLDMTGKLILPGDPAGGTVLIAGTRTVKHRLIGQTNADVCYLTTNATLNAAQTAWVQDDVAKPSWLSVLNPAGDAFQVYRIVPGGTTTTTLLNLDANGILTIPGTTSATVKIGTRAQLYVDGSVSDYYNNSPTDVGYTIGSPGWMMRLQSSGGDLAGFWRRAPGQGTWNQSICYWDASGNMVIMGPTATKASGTTWANPSDRRLKDEIADYTTSLSAILQLTPRTFLFNGKGGSQAGMRGYGFIADEVAPVMPEMVGVRAGKLDPSDAEETDIQTLDQSNLILALVNAVKELATRLAIVEAKP